MVSYGVKNGMTWYKVKDPRRCPLRVLFFCGYPQSSSTDDTLVVRYIWTYKISAITGDIHEGFEYDFPFYRDNVEEITFDEWVAWVCSL